jgi:2-keto-4-pentenoate hydratase/2-oxohepta-3-ene-1,7-dioic acid hydratase in catechol pathway
MAAPGKMLFVGANYRDHIEEAPLEMQIMPTEPFIFAKLPSSVIGPGEPIVIPPGPESHVDYEAELAAVIGTRCRNVAAADALAHVFGYTIVNDVSEREVQMTRSQMILGKGVDTFCPLGPAVVCSEELGDPGALRLWTRVNGELRQDTSTAAMLFGVAQIIEHIAALVTLEPGDVVATGTPAGVGVFRSTFLQHGDTVTVGIDGIGELTNPVAATSSIDRDRVGAVTKPAAS